MDTHTHTHKHTHTHTGPTDLFESATIAAAAAAAVFFFLVERPLPKTFSYALLTPTLRLLTRQRPKWICVGFA